MSELGDIQGLMFTPTPFFATVPKFSGSPKDIDQLSLPKARWSQLNWKNVKTKSKVGLHMKWTTKPHKIRTKPGPPLQTVISINHRGGLKLFYCPKIFTLGPNVIWVPMSFSMQ